MFSCTLKKGHSFKTLISAIPSDIKLGEFYFGNDSLEFQGYNAKSTALVFIQIAAPSFSTYKCDTAITHGVNVESLKKIGTLMKVRDELYITLNRKEASAIIFQYESKRSACTLTLRTLTTNIEKMDIIVPFEVIFEIKLHEFYCICQDLSKIGNKIIINISKTGKIEFKSKGIDIDVSFVGKAIQIIKKAKLSFSYNLQYIELCLKSFISSKISSKLLVKMHTNLPLCLETETNIGTIGYYLAPVI